MERPETTPEEREGFFALHLPDEGSRAVLESIAREGQSTAQQIGSRDPRRLPPETVRAALASLETRGLVRRAGGDYALTWRGAMVAIIATICFPESLGVPQERFPGVAREGFQDGSPEGEFFLRLLEAAGGMEPEARSQNRQVTLLTFLAATLFYGVFGRGAERAGGWNSPRELGAWLLDHAALIIDPASSQPPKAVAAVVPGFMALERIGVVEENIRLHEDALSDIRRSEGKTRRRRKAEEKRHWDALSRLQRAQEESGKIYTMAMAQLEKMHKTG